MSNNGDSGASLSGTRRRGIAGRAVPHCARQALWAPKSYRGGWDARPLSLNISLQGFLAQLNSTAERASRQRLLTGRTTLARFLVSYPETATKLS